jgi:hypothetical protein
MHFSGWSEAQDYYFDEGLTDGLPIVPPTPERVAAMLDYCGLATGDILGTEGIRRKSLLAEKVAANAVMAGCLPEYFPVVVAAISAICDRTYNLHASSTSTNGITNLALISGPYAARIGMNDGVGLMGNGNRANATIGRAINLVKSNYYGSVAGDMDKSTFGHSGKFSFCFAENLRVSPWIPLAEHKGFQRASSTVTMVAANAPLQFECHGDKEPEGFLTAAAHALMGLGSSLSEIVLVISPELMSHIAASGWSREQVQTFVHEKSQLTARDWDRWRRMDKLPPDADFDRVIGSVAGPERITIVPAGGDAGEFMAIISAWGSSRSVTKEIVVPG